MWRRRPNVESSLDEVDEAEEIEEASDKPNPNQKRLKIFFLHFYSIQEEYPRIRVFKKVCFDIILYIFKKMNLT